LTRHAPLAATEPSARSALFRRPFPRQLLLGVALVAIWWPVAWLHLKPPSDYYFFPLWLGYILTLDGVVAWRTGSSLWRRGRDRFVLLFAMSVPFWWVFEWMNRYLQDWHYVTTQPYSWLQYHALASLAFSTVVPAVLEGAELLASFRAGHRLPQLPRWHVGGRGRVLFEVLGWTMVLLVVTVPRYAFPFAWLSVFCIVEPLNAALRRRSIAAFVRDGNWAPIWNVMLAALGTGFFWEMWNSQAIPKWYYTVPFVGFAHVFEMPVLGYTGYLPFGLEIFAVYAMGSWLLRWRDQQYARVGADDESPAAATAAAHVRCGNVVR